MNEDIIDQVAQAVWEQIRSPIYDTSTMLAPIDRPSLQWADEDPEIRAIARDIAIAAITAYEREISQLSQPL